MASPPAADAAATGPAAPPAAAPDPARRALHPADAAAAFAGKTWPREPAAPASPPDAGPLLRDPAPRHSDCAVVIGFTGSLRELLRLCRRAAAGTIIDLADGSVYASEPESTIPETWESEAPEEAPVPLCASIINSNADLVRVGLTSLRLAQASTDDVSGSRADASNSSSAVTRGRRGSARVSGERWRPQSPRSLTIAGAAEPHGMWMKDWSALMDAATASAASSGSAASAAAAEVAPSAGTASDAAAGEGPPPPLPPPAPPSPGAAAPLDAPERVPWRHSLGRATHKHDGSTSSASGGKLSQRTNPSVQLGPAGPCVSPITIVPDGTSRSAAVQRGAPANLRLVADRITVRNGNLTLPQGSTLVLEGALVLDNMTIRGDSGGAVAPAAGSTPLVYVAAAAVTMHSCVVTGNASGHGIGVGERGALGLGGCEVSEHSAGGVVVVGRGAELTAVATVFDRNRATGAHVGGAAHATFTRCTFSSNWSAGLAATDGDTRVAARACVCEHNAAGAVAQNGAAVTLAECELEGNSKGALAAHEGTVLRYEGGKVSGSSEAAGARGGAEVHLSSLDVSDCDNAFTAADAGSVLRAHTCTTTRAESHGAFVTGGATLALDACDLSDCAVHGACGQDAGSVLNARGSTFARNGSTGVMVGGGAHADVAECKVESNKVAGVLASGGGTVAELSDTVAEHNGTIGVFGGGGACVRVHNGRLVHNGSSGAEIRDAASRLELSDTEVSGNGRVAVYAHSGATAACVRCKIRAGGDCAVLCGGREGVDVRGGDVCIDSCDADARHVERHGGSIAVCERAATNGGAHAAHSS